MTTKVLHSDSVRERFWRYTYRRQDHQCWPWTGSRMVRGGYGQLNDKGRLLKAHRLSWELHFGAIPDDLLIRHMCHNPKCCNPSHLLPGTLKDNHLDMQKANRMYVPEARRGEHNCQAVLTEDNVRFIRQSDMRGVDLAKRFNVTKFLISRIRSGKSWKHIL